MTALVGVEEQLSPNRDIRPFDMLLDEFEENPQNTAARTDSDVDAETFSHLFRNLSNDDDAINSDTSLRVVLTLLRIPIYRSLLCGKQKCY